jgi:flavin-dependent dehydrogenase
LIDDIRGWGLPLGTKRRAISGDGFLLTGDAASLIDPFTGEGIGNAMTSGRLAAMHAAAAVHAGRFDTEFLKRYDEKVYSNLWKELRLSRTLQRLSGHAWLFNLVVNKATSSRVLRDAITGMFDDVDARSRLGRPGFYLQLLFNKN